MKNERSLRRRWTVWAALGGGGLVLSCLSPELALTLRFLALAIPVLFAVRIWGRRAGWGIALVLGLCALPGLGNGLWTFDGGMLAMGLVLGMVIGNRGRAPVEDGRLETGLIALGERLSGVTNVDQLWDGALAELKQAISADGVAWVDKDSEAPLRSQGLTLEAVSWFALAQLVSDSPVMEHGPVVAACGVSSAMAIPLQITTRSGTLVLVRSSELFSVAEFSLARALISALRPALDNGDRLSLMQQTANWRQRELEALHEIGRLMGERLDPEQVMDEILNLLRISIPYEMAEINLWDPDRQYLTCWAVSQDEATRRYEAGTGQIYYLNEGLTGWLTRNRRPLLLQNVAEFEEAQPKLKLVELSVQSFIGVPLLARGDFLGTLEMAAFRQHQFTPQHLDLLQAVGIQVAAAIDNARLFQAEQRRLQVLEQLRETAGAVGRAVDANALFAEISQRVADLFKVEIAGVLLLDKERQQLSARAPFFGVNAAWVSNYVVQLPRNSHREQVFQQTPYWIIEDVPHSPDVESLGLLELAFVAKIQQTLLVPLEASGERIGFLQIANPRGRRRFTADDAQMLQMLASQVSGMVRFSQLLERTEGRARHMEALVSVASAIGGSLDQTMVLNAIVQAVFDVMSCQRAVIFVLDPRTQVLNRVAMVGQENNRILPEIPLSYGAQARAIANNSVIVVEDSLNSNPTGKSLSNIDLCRAFADVPLRRGENPVGLLSVQFSEPHHFTTEEMDLLRILAEEAAVAIENIRLFSQTDDALRRRVYALETLQRINREIIATLDLTAILQVVLREAVQFGGAEAGVVLLQQDQSWMVGVAQGYTAEDLAQVKALITENGPFPFNEFLQRPQVTLIPDLSIEPGCTWPLSNTHTFLVAPVFFEEQLASVILLHSSRSDVFDAAFRDFMQGVVGQLAFAISNARQYREQVERGELMRRRAEQVARLLEVIRTMRSDRPMDDVLQDVSYAVQEGTEYDLVLISILEGDTLRRVAGAGMPLADLDRLKRVRSPWSRVKLLFQERFRLGRCYYIPAEWADVAQNLDRFTLDPGGVVREAGHWHPADALLVPLRNTRGDVIGMMSVDNPRSGLMPTTNSVEVLELFAAQVALAIENNVLFEDLRRQLNTLRLFNELSRSITTKLDLNLLLGTVAQAVTQLLNYDYTTVFIQNKETQRFEARASSGYPMDMIYEYSFAPGAGNDGVIDVVAQTGMPLVLDDTSADSRFKPGPLPIGSSVLVPLIVDARVVGILTADRKQVGDFSPTEVATLTALADQVAVAVENARLFDEVTRFSNEMEKRVELRTAELGSALDELRRERDRTDVLYRIASELVSSLDLDRVLDKALSFLRDAVKAERGSVLLLDPNTNKLIYRAGIGHQQRVAPGGVPARFKLTEGLVGWVLSKRQSVVIEDVDQDPRWIKEEDDVTRSVLAVPIKGTAGEALGAIFLHSSMMNAFAEIDARLVEAAATQLGNALNNAELYRLIREQAERLGVMLRTQQVESVKNQAILEGIADGVMMADANGRVILFNAAAERIFSLNRSQALGRMLDEMLGLYGSRAREWLDIVHQWKENPDAYEAGQYFSDRLDVDRQMISVHCSPVFSGSHELLGVVSVFRDVTAEVMADRAKSEFVSNVSHELRTPMTSVKGYVDLLLMGATGPLTDMQRNFLTVIKTNADRLTALVNDILDLSRIETGKVKLDRSPAGIEPLIEQVAASMLPKIQEKKMQLTTVVPEGLPKVFGDPSRMIQILTNLVGNSYKYTPEGGAIIIHAYVRNGMMHVGVEDTGMGISKEDQQKIFDRFFRVDNPAVHEVSGTGLGLSITTSLIQMHGGDIWVESELGVGSIFTFTLPLAEGELKEDVGTPPRKFGEPLTTILVVEDDVDVARLIQLTLETQGRRVLMATSGEEALRVARKERPQLISLDIRLPDLDGFEVLQLLKRDPETADIPVVIVSVVLDVEQGLRLGAAEYLTKPLDEAQLQSVVDRVLTQKGLVLIVDDDKETLALMREALRTQGLGVRTTARGGRALSLARELNPALILLDLKLPDIDGYQVLEELKRDTQTADIPVIVLTGSVLDEGGKAQEFQALGALRFLTKPFSVEALASEISSFVDHQAKI